MSSLMMVCYGHYITVNPLRGLGLLVDRKTTSIVQFYLMSLPSGCYSVSCIVLLDCHLYYMICSCSLVHGIATCTVMFVFGLNFVPHSLPQPTSHYFLNKTFSFVRDCLSQVRSSLGCALLTLAFVDNYIVHLTFLSTYR